MIVIVPIEKEKIPSLWYEMRDYLLKPMIQCTTIDRFPLDDILLSLITGARQSWVIFNAESDKIEAYFVTEITNYPNGSAVNLFLLGGENLDLWRDSLTDCLFDYAKAVGAKWLDTHSRRGFWKKALKNLDFKEESTHYSIAI
jgi:hypothetical protein